MGSASTVEVGIRLGQLLGPRPVRGDPAPVEQAGFGADERAGAHRRHPPAAWAPSARIQLSRASSGAAWVPLPPGAPGCRSARPLGQRGRAQLEAALRPYGAAARWRRGSPGSRRPRPRPRLPPPAPVKTSWGPTASRGWTPSKATITMWRCCTGPPCGPGAHGVNDMVPTDSAIKDLRRPGPVVLLVDPRPPVRAVEPSEPSTGGPAFSWAVPSACPGPGPRPGGHPVRRDARSR